MSGTDIWAWVRDTHGSLAEAGHHRLAQAIVDIPGHATDGRSAQLDAVHPEALAAARALDLPWVEVYLRHWRLQSLLNKRQQGEAALAEAVSLLEFAHREETADCPQSVCTVQDFAICHARIDGPGYVAERLAVLDETLERVEPSRACFDCLSREYSDTLEDDGRPADALAHLDAAAARMHAAGQHPSLDLHLSRAGALHLLGRHEEVLTALDEAEKGRLARGLKPDEDDRRSLALARARALAALGRAEEAAQLLPSAEDAEEYPDLRAHWAETVEVLAGLGAVPADAALGARLARWAGYLDGVGSHRPCLDLVLVAGRLAVARGARTVALALADTAERKLADLRRTDGVADRTAALRAAAEALPVPGLPVPAEGLLAWLSGQDGPVEDGPAEDAAAEDGDGQGARTPHDPEAHLDLVAAARAQRPGDSGLLVAQASLLGALGLARPAADLMWRGLDAHPDDEHLAGALVGALVEARDGDGVRRLADRLAAAGRAEEAHWTRARWAAAEARWSEVAEECAAIVARAPDRINTRRLWARAAAELGDHAAVQRLCEEILEHALPDGGAGPEEEHRTVRGADLWALVVAATVNRDWAAVRAAACRLGMEFDSDEGPVDEEWQVVAVRVTGDRGTHTDLPAVRTGPATARILPVTGDDVPVNHGDTVVFEPSLLEPRPQTEEELRHWRPLFGMVALLDPAGYTTYWIDGAWPGDEAWAALRDGLRGLGYGVWAWSGGGYRVTDPGGGEPLPGLYAAVGVPPLASAAEADAHLARLTAGWEHPLAWPGLAEAAGADTAPHRDTVERYGL
ncbi:hypothetical protein LO771_08610 [Streptacidiphilus sp. ASG 303]|uniref:hypothetical protein n=1 Tax=Streptacidiphilus sp. ASG 303 TaxID=2896847 RepID=UPI001E48B4F6|nr:hypothetical protein [Streptacidiphilus sp. ASG 303]MCD0482461.1 hypothetical protein [Streptacidiphilus sp. ASG 303]